MNPLTHGFSGGSAVKNPAATQKTWIHFLGQEVPWEKENGNPFQYSCLGNPMDRGAWQVTVHGVTKDPDTTYQLNNNKNKCIYPLKFR